MIGGKANEVSAANTQWVRLPSDCPRPRIRFGKISEMNTQITEPWPNGVRGDEYHQPDRAPVSTTWW